MGRLDRGWFQFIAGGAKGIVAAIGLNDCYPGIIGRAQYPFGGDAPPAAPRGCLCIRVGSLHPDILARARGPLPSRWGIWVDDVAHRVATVSAENAAVNARRSPKCGGDGFVTFAKGTNPVVGPLDLDSMEAYFRGQEIVQVPPVGRVTMVGG